MHMLKLSQNKSAKMGGFILARIETEGSQAKQALVINLFSAGVGLVGFVVDQNVEPLKLPRPSVLRPFDKTFHFPHRHRGGWSFFSLGIPRNFARESVASRANFVWTIGLKRLSLDTITGQI